jgi:hypothetical protein
LTGDVPGDIFQLTIGGLAQLGERQAGSLKVTGSSPVYSTFLSNYAWDEAPDRWGFFHAHHEVGAYAPLVTIKLK